MPEFYSSETAARPETYDRNPLAVTAVYEGSGLAPHGFTIRSTYTVPSGKKAWLDSLFTLVRRITVAAPAATVQASVYYDPVVGSNAYLGRALLWTNAVDDKDVVQLSPGSVMFAGDSINIATGDGSTGGTVDYNTYIKVTEFDA